MRIIVTLAGAALFFCGVTLAPEARAQLDSSCKTTPNPVKTDPNPITTCSFDANQQGITWLQVQSPVPPNTRSYAGSQLGNADNTVCWVTDTPSGNKWSQQWEFACAPAVVNGLLTAQDTFAGFNGPFNGCTVNFIHAETDANCNTLSTPSILGSLTTPNKTNFPFTINLNTGQAAVAPTTTCVHKGVSFGWFFPGVPGQCPIGGQQPPPFVGAATYTWTLGQPTWSDARRQKSLSEFGTSSGNVGAVVSVLATRVAALASPWLGAGLTIVSVGANTAAGIDPPDLNYQSVVTPTPPNIDLSGFPPAAAALMQLVEQQIGLLNAISTTANRATGANIAGDSGSQQLQVAALPNFEQQADAVAAQLPAALAAWGQELVSEGFDPRSIAQSDVQAFQKSVATSGIPSTILTKLTALGADTNTITQAQKLLIAADPARAASVAQNLLNYGPLMPPVLSAAQNQPLLAAVLPVSRAVATSKPATAFATIINTGSATATACGIAPDTPAPVTFSYQTTNPATNALTGTLNTPVDIPAGASQSYVISVTPTLSGGGFAPLFVNFAFFCSNANVAPVTSGLNTLLLSSPPGPPADIVALAASGDPGIVDIPGANGTGAFAVATVNVGSSNSITASAVPSDASLPITINICQTNPQTGQCLAPPAPSVTTQINAGDTPTFGFFVTGSATVPFDPTNNRVVAEFFDSTNTIRGATSVAVRTQ